MLVWLSLAAPAAILVLAATGGLSVRRYSAHHVAGHVSVRGRGLYFSRTPDGAWWRLRLRPCRRRCEDRGSGGEPPPDGGVREPRRPGPAPVAGAAELDHSR
jgi:hypothetical protein